MAWKTRESGATWVYELEADPGPAPGSPAARGAAGFALGTSLLGPVIGGAEGHDAELADGIRTTLERIRADGRGGLRVRLSGMPASLLWANTVRLPVDLSCRPLGSEP